jgi:GNAT superfamily N-acetyltransferase
MKPFTEVLNKNHVYDDFTCGEELLDNYLKRQASQDVRKKLAACFVLAAKESNVIQGYFTLSNNSIPQELIPEDLKKHFPKSYLSIPATLLGRLAVDKNFKGKGIGELLLLDALKKSYEISKVIGSFAVVTDPINEKAEKFYLKYGFQKLPDSGKMFLPMKTISQLFE